tara:strand:- start:85 stop:264 length:180 start_codon:yes stop_codon:yes gene_type:complete
MQLFSIGNLYIGKDNESFTDISIHLGRYRIEYGSPNLSSHGNEDGRQDGKAVCSLPKHP